MSFNFRFAVLYVFIYIYVFLSDEYYSFSNAYICIYMFFYLMNIALFRTCIYIYMRSKKCNVYQIEKKNVLNI